MNILQVLPSMDVGGVETGTLDLARYLASRGHKVIVVSGGGRLVKELDAVNVRHYSLPVGKKSPVAVMRMVGALREVIRREEIEIVHARSRVPALTAYVACKLSNKVFITTAHGYYKKHLLSRAMAWGRFVIVASNIMAKHMMAGFGVPYERIRFIPRGVDLERFKFRDPQARRLGGFAIGMVSRITPLKGHADFIKAASILARQIPQLRCMIVGDAAKPKYKEELELLTRRLGLTRTVEFIPATKEVPDIMAGLDCLVSATVTPEAFGRAIVEAQASGVPVVATKVGGVVDIIDDEKTGLLCPAYDPKGMADRILRLYHDRSAWTALAREARKSVETNFNLNKMMEKTLAVYEESLKVQNILVIKMSAIGDVILAIPSLRAIRAKFPNARIKVLVGLRSREALDKCPYADDLIVCDFNGKDKGLVGLWRLGALLRKGCFDIVIDLQNNRKSHCLAALSLAFLRYGYDNRKFSFLLNRRIKDDAPYLDPIEHQFRTLKLAGIKPQEKKIELWPSEFDDKAAEKILSDGWVKPTQALVGINVRASSRWYTKNWPASYIAELSDKLAKLYNARVVLTGAASDLDFANEIAGRTKSKPIVAAGRTTVMELASLMKHFKIYLTPDSAPMHIASALGVPFIALFGPTDPARHLAPSQYSVVLCKKGDVKCSPCYKPTCLKDLRCMKKITVDEVLNVMKDFLTKDSGA